MNHIIMENYEIFYDRRNVTVYSTERLFLEPKKDWQVKMKHDVRTAVEQLRAVTGEGVVAVYG